MKGRQSDKALEKRRMRGGFLSGLRAISQLKKMREIHPAVEKVEKFRRKLDFNNMMASGKYSKEQAAQAVGVELRPGEQLRQEDYLKLSTEGELPQRKRKIL